MSPTRIAAVALLVAVAGCSGFSGGAGTTAETPEPTTAPATVPTTEQTTVATTTHSTDETTAAGTEPHTAEGTSHVDTHLVVDAATGVDNVTVQLGTGDAAETYAVENGDVDLTREIHDRGHEVRAVVYRGDEAVFNHTVYGYQYWEVTVYENDTSVRQTVV